MTKSYRVLTSLLCGCLAYAMLNADEIAPPVEPPVNPNAAPSSSPSPQQEASPVTPTPETPPAPSLEPSLVQPPSVQPSTPPAPEAPPVPQTPPKPEVVPSPAAPPAAVEECPPVTQAYPHRIQVKQTSGKGIGYNHGYSTLELFFSPWICFDKYFPFIDLRAHRFIVGKYAANAGIGLRGYSSTRKSFWGINAYYDYRQTHHKNFKQASLGLEYLTLHFDWRINGYYPFGGTKSGTFGVKFDHFSGHNFFVRDQREFAMPGVDTEMAYHWNPSKNVEVTTAIGPYYFHGNFDKYAVGGKARAKIDLWNLLSFEGNVSYDNLFKWIGQGQISLTIPLGFKKVGSTISKSDCPHAFTLGKRQAQPVERQEIIVTSRHRSRALAINPATGQPWNIIFVNNTSHSNGTIESPYPTLLQAQNASKPNDIIYVFTGDGTSNGMNAGITLKDQQLFFGSSISHTVPTQLGKVTIPAQTSTLPFITNPGAAVVTLANQNTVSGFQIGTSAIGIQGNGIVGTNIENNAFSSSASVGISLVNTQRDVHILNNTIVGMNVPNEFGININNTNTNSQIRIENNTILNHNGTGISIEGNGNALIETKILRNTVNGPIANVGASAIELTPNDTSTLKAEVTGNTTNDQNFSIVVLSQAPSLSNINATFSNNNIKIANINNGSGIALLLFQTNQCQVQCSNNTINGGNVGGILLFSQNSGVIQGSFLQNTISNSGGGFADRGGVSVIVTGPATVQAQIKNNTLTNNFLGVGVHTSGSGITCVDIQSNVSNTNSLLQNDGAGVLNAVPGFQTSNTPTNSFTIVGPVTSVPSCN